MFRTLIVRKHKLCATRVLHLRILFASAVNKMLRKECQGHSTLVKNTTAGRISISDVLIACEILNVFPERLKVYHLTEEFKFCISEVSDTTPIFVLLYRIALPELRKLNK